MDTSTRINSRSKGRKAEQDVANIFRTSGYCVERNLNQSINGGCDLIKANLSSGRKLSVEIKHQKTLNLKAWWAQTLNQTSKPDLPVLFFKTNYKPWQVKTVLRLSNDEDVAITLSVADFFKYLNSLQNHGLTAD